jgi:hypothetical protein
LRFPLPYEELDDRPIRGADFKNQSAILLLAVLNRRFG